MTNNVQKTLVPVLFSTTTLSFLIIESTTGNKNRIVADIPPNELFKLMSTSSIPTIITTIFEVNNDTSSDFGGSDEYLIILPLIVLFGLCGNIISLVTIFHSRLRKMAANQYLIVLTIADSVFLFGIIMVLFKVDFTGYFLCVGIEYVLMSASYVSSWSIAALTIERYLAIAHPLKHVQYGYVSRWRMMCFWVPIPFLLNLVQFITLSPNSDPSDPNWPNVRKCTVKDGELQMVVELIDVVLCYILPCFIVVVLNLLIASKVESAEKMFYKTSPKAHKPSSNSFSKLDSPKMSLINNGEVSAKHSYSSNKRNPRLMPKISNGGSVISNTKTTSLTIAQSGSSASSSGSTKILVVVPLVYILLNSPFYLFRIIDTIALNIFQCKTFSIQGGLNDSLILFLYNAAHYLYYVNFACDFVVYAFSSKNFRRTVVIAWRRLLCAKWAKEKEHLESIARNSYNRCSNVISNEHVLQRTVRLNGPNSTTSISQANSSVVTVAETSAVYTSMRRSSTFLSHWQRDL